jgi:hypothetical protein
MVFLRLKGIIKKYDQEVGVGPNSKKRFCIVSMHDLMGML